MGIQALARIPAVMSVVGGYSWQVHLSRINSRLKAANTVCYVLGPWDFSTVVRVVAAWESITEIMVQTVAL